MSSPTEEKRLLEVKAMCKRAIAHIDTYLGEKPEDQSVRHLTQINSNLIEAGVLIFKIITEDKYVEPNRQNSG